MSLRRLEPCRDQIEIRLRCAQFAAQNDMEVAEVDIAVHALNRMVELGRPSYVRIA